MKKILIAILMLLSLPAWAGPTISGSGGSGGADASGYYVVTRATSAPTNGVNLGALTTGFLKCTTAGSICTLSTDTNVPTATALAANPTDCESLGLATAIDAYGNLTCGYSIGTDVQAFSTSLSTLAGRVFSKGVLTGAGGLDTVTYNSIMIDGSGDGTIGIVATTGGIIYWYVFEASSSAAESSPNVIAPDDVGANTGRWLLKLYCDGSSCTVPQGATGAYTTLLEGSGNGTNFRKTSVPDDLTASLTMTHPNAVPTAMSVLAFPAPTADVSAGSWLSMTDRLVATFDGGGSEIADSKKVYIYVPWDCTITGWTILADQSGAIKVDVWNDTYANYPPTDADSITAAHEPEIAASATKAQDLDVADWGGENLTGGTVLAFNIDSCTTITWAQVTLHVVRR